MADPRDHVLSVRLSAEESAYLDQLTDVHVTDRSSMIRHLILSAPLWRMEIMAAQPPECLCDLIEVSTAGRIEYVRGLSNGCLRHPAGPAQAAMVQAQRAREAELEAVRAAARRKARER